MWRRRRPTSPPELFHEREVLHFIDNTSALYGLAKGYSSQPDSSAIIRAFHVANIRLRANVWFNYVATKANVADLPSRGALDLLFSCLSSFLAYLTRPSCQDGKKFPVFPTNCGTKRAANLIHF